MPDHIPVIIVAPTCVRYTFHHLSTAGDRWDNVEDISIDAAGIFSRDDVVNDFNSVIAGYWQDSMLSMYGNGTGFLGATWIDLHTSTGRTGTLGPAAGHPTGGGQNAPWAPPQVCRLIKKQVTSVRGTRSGRTYINNIPEGNVDDNGNLAAAHMNACTALAESFRSTIAAYSHTGVPAVHPCAWRVVHVHKTDPENPTTWTWSSSDVQSVSCDPKVATQRRRVR